MPNVWATLRQCRLRPATACVCWRISASSRLAHSGCRPSSLACSAHHLNTHLDPQFRGSAPGLVDIDLGDPSTQHCPGTRPQDALTPHTAHRQENMDLPGRASRRVTVTGSCPIPGRHFAARRISHSLAQNRLDHPHETARSHISYLILRVLCSAVGTFQSQR
jgi:hypothetical protein